MDDYIYLEMQELFQKQLAWRKATGREPDGDDLDAYVIPLESGDFRFFGYGKNAVRMKAMLKQAQQSRHFRALVQRTDLSATIFYITPDGVPHYQERNNIIVIPRTITPHATQALTHEIAHKHQISLGLSCNRYDINLFDMFLEDSIAEGAALAHGEQAAWDLHYRKASPAWREMNEKDAAFIQPRPRWHVFARDVKTYRQAGRAESFKAFSTDPVRAAYEQEMCKYINLLLPDDLRRHLLAPKRPRAEYDAILAAHGLPDLHRHIPDLDWDSPAWSGISQKSHDRLYCIIRDKCPDLLEHITFPPIHVISKTAMVHPAPYPRQNLEP